MDRGAIRRRLAVGLALLTASGLLAVAVPAEAQAAASRCEGRKVRTYPFATGTLYVYKRGGHICAITVPKDPGRRQKMMVSVQAYRARAVVDEGQYSRRAARSPSTPGTAACG